MAMITTTTVETTAHSAIDWGTKKGFSSVRDGMAFGSMSSNFAYCISDRAALYFLEEDIFVILAKNIKIKVGDEPFIIIGPKAHKNI